MENNKESTGFVADTVRLLGLCMQHSINENIRDEMSRSSLTRTTNSLPPATKAPRLSRHILSAAFRAFGIVNEWLNNVPICDGGTFNVPGFADGIRSSDIRTIRFNISKSRGNASRCRRLSSGCRPRKFQGRSEPRDWT